MNLLIEIGSNFFFQACAAFIQEVVVFGLILGCIIGVLKVNEYISKTK